MMDKDDEIQAALIGAEYLWLDLKRKIKERRVELYQLIKNTESASDRHLWRGVSCGLQEVLAMMKTLEED